MSQRILVIKLGALGDIFLALDAFHAIREHHRGDHICLLTRPQFASLAAKMPWFQEVWTDAGAKPWQIGQWLALRRKLRSGKFTRVYDLQCNDRTGFYFRLFGRNPPEWSGHVKGCSHPRPDFSGQRVHTTERLLRQLETARVPRAGKADLSWLDGPLQQFHLPMRFVALVPGCSPHRLNKRWPAAFYAELSQRLLAHGLGSVLVGTAADREAIETILKLAPHAVSLAEKTDLGQLAALARGAVAVVANDTGPAHVMATTGAPTLVLMCGESDSITMLPAGPAVGCLQRDSLDQLSVDEVWNTLQSRRPTLTGDNSAVAPQSTKS